MTQLLRNVGFGLVFMGAILMLFWAIEPLRMVWPWLWGLPLPIRVGVIVAAFGLVVLMGSLVSERIRDREADKELRDEF
jgi:hypothetical protein